MTNPTEILPPATRPAQRSRLSRRWRIAACALVAHLVPWPAAVAAEPAAAPRVLLVVSGEGRDGGRTRPGFEMEEFAQAWRVLRANGLAVDVASPAGGAVEADRYNPDTDLIRALKADAAAVAALQATRRTADVSPTEHAAILVVGGKGAMFDLPRDAALRALLGAHHQAGGVLAAVCHGPAVFTEVRLADGRPLLTGRRVTGFTNEEEVVFGKRWAREFPFWIETRAREQGARWEEAPMMLPRIVVDGRLITGQNPASTAGVAEAVVRALGRRPVARVPLQDEATLALAQQVWAGDADAAAAALRGAPDRYQPALLGALGYYHLEHAADPATRERALALMALAAPSMKHPQLKLGMARAHLALGRVAQARELLVAAAAESPDFVPVQHALAALRDADTLR